MSDVPLAIGIDFGGTSVKTGVLYHGNLIEEAPRIDTQEFEEARPLIERIHETVKNLRSSHPRIEAIGVGMPGFVDFPTGMVHNLTNVKGWQRIYLKRELNELANLPVTVENDANCMAYAEWKRGSGRGMSHLVALTLGTGVGGGIVIDNRMVRGANFVAGELGQTSIDYQGPDGAYGNRGSLEDYVGNQQITDMALKAYADAGKTMARSDCEPAHLTGLALKGDEIALSIWDRVAKKLSTALMNCCWLLNPEAIIIGGGVAKAGSLLFDPLEKHLRAQLSPAFKENLRLLPARFGNEAGMVGAATLALEEAGFNIDD
jgi:glucokinase|tara:strand:+ start:11587 stop:12540 length:954 start_codon:yes stop_codon:yes gene_type:complete